MRRRTKLGLKCAAAVAVSVFTLDFAITVRSCGPRFECFGNVSPVVYPILILPISVAFLILWGLKRGAVSALGSLLIIILTAHAVGSIEEHLFVKKHASHTVGPTPRVLDRNSWLAYDAQTGRLTGAD